MDEVESKVSTLLQKSQVRELAWKKVSSAKYRFGAIKVCDFIADLAFEKRLRVDVLIWDTQDSRHSIRRRDDTANLARMYYHLVSVVTKKRWDLVASWLIRVDQRNDMDWNTLEDCLSGRTRSEKVGQQPKLANKTSARMVRPPRIKQVSSSDQPLIQIADLFAGLAAFSWNNRQEYRNWKMGEQQVRHGQQSMFSDMGNTQTSNSVRFKHEVLDHIASMELPGVAMNEENNEGLRTFRPTKNRINFWLYIPQREGDKAPTRQLLNCRPDQRRRYSMGFI